MGDQRISAGLNEGLRVSCLPPQVGAGCRVLILGSLPGTVSLAQAQYYAHPRNQFWQILGGVFGINFPELPYPERLLALNGRGIGLWDSISSAERQGSLDGAIRAPQSNRLQEFVEALSMLRVIAFNGARAASVGAQVLTRSSQVERLALPSTSPAYTLPIGQKLEAWSVLKRLIPASE